jgi:hypothetical protein
MKQEISMLSDGYLENVRREVLPDEFGFVQKTLNNGTYSYVVTAKDYHEERGTFVVSGSKVNKVVELRPAFGWVSIADVGVLNNADVYIDGNHVGKTPITSAKLSSGVHNIKIVKDLYLPFEENITIQDNVLLQYEPKLVANFATTTLTTTRMPIFISTMRSWVEAHGRATSPRESISSRPARQITAPSSLTKLSALTLRSRAITSARLSLSWAHSTSRATLLWQMYISTTSSSAKRL